MTLKAFLFCEFRIASEKNICTTIPPRLPMLSAIPKSLIPFS